MSLDHLGQDQISLGLATSQDAAFTLLGFLCPWLSRGMLGPRFEAVVKPEGPVLQPELTPGIGSTKLTSAAGTLSG